MRFVTNDSVEGHILDVHRLTALANNRRANQQHRRGARAQALGATEPPLAGVVNPEAAVYVNEVELGTLVIVKVPS